MKLLLLTLLFAIVFAQQSPERFNLQDITTRFYTNQELEEFMNHFTRWDQCGSISRKFSIGKSVLGAELWVLEISNNPGAMEPKPNFKYIANMHGDETGGRQLTIGLARWLCDQYMTDPTARRIVDEMHLFLMPTMNPDGYDNGPQRYNMNGQDLNRDFPDRIRHGPTLPQTGTEQPETVAVMNWVMGGSFVASANLHEGAIVANYPWDASDDGSPGYAACPDDVVFSHMARLFAQSHGFMANSQEFEGGITNGNDWYAIYGGMQDWNYIKADCWELTLELNLAKDPPASELPQMWEDNYSALLNLALEGALGGVRGTVKARDTQEPLEATISVDGIEKTIMSGSAFGDFYRPLAPGQYCVTVSAPGYRTSKRMVTVPSGVGEGYILNLFLSKGSNDKRNTNKNTSGDKGDTCETGNLLADRLAAMSRG